MNGALRYVVRSSNGNARAQVRVVVWIHKCIGYKVVYYAYRNERIQENGLKISGENLRVNGIYSHEEGREDFNDEFYKKYNKYSTELTN